MKVAHRLMIAGVLLLTVTSTGAADEKLIKGQIEALKDSSLEKRLKAAATLNKLGPNDVAAVPVLCEALLEKEAQVRFTAATALGKIGPGAEVSVPLLVALLKDPKEWVRWEAVRALGKIGATAEEALPALRAATKDASPVVCAAATVAVKQIDTENEAVRQRNEHVEKTVSTLKDSTYWPDRYRAAGALGKLGPGAASAVPALRDALSDKEPLMRLKAAEALGKIGPAAESAVSDLVLLLKDPKKEVREEAARALGRIGAAAVEALPALRAASKDTAAAVCAAAAAAVEQIEADKVPARERKEIAQQIERTRKFVDLKRKEFEQQNERKLKEIEIAACKELKRLEGTWVVVEVEAEGKKIEEKLIQKLDARISFSGQWVDITSTMENTPVKGNVSLDPTEGPRQFDLTTETGSEQSPYPGLPGIYDLTDDTLKLCITSTTFGPIRRPTEFTTQETETGSGPMIVVLKRLKK